MTESKVTTINNLAQSALDEFEEMNTEQQLDFAKDILRQIKNICYTLSKTRYYVRVCKNRFDELDIENLSIYTLEDIKEEFIEIDYISEEEADSLDFADLQEIAINNNEFLEEIEVVKYL